MKKVLEIDGLSYRYPVEGDWALQDLSLTVGEGESVGLIGPNGAGKSTLLLHLNGILQADGRVKLFGLPAIRGNLKEIRSRVGLVFQDPDDQLFMPTVFDDVAFGPLNMGLPAEEIRRRVAGALERVGLEGFERRVPHHMSGGEKRRVAIATVISMEPSLLVLDEPGADLDPRGRREFIELLNGLALTKIIASHDLDLIRRTCSRCIVLDGGRIVADGPAEEILSSRDLLEAHGLL